MSTIFNWKRSIFGFIAVTLALTSNEPSSMAASTATKPAVTQKIRVEDDLAIVRIDVYFYERGPNGGGVGKVRIELKHPSGKITTITGMGGGKYDPTDKRIHPTTGSYWNVGEAREVKTYSKPYHAWLDYWVPFGDGQGFHVGNLSDRSHGCIHLSMQDAKRIYYHAANHIPVEIHVPAAKALQSSADKPGVKNGIGHELTESTPVAKNRGNSKSHDKAGMPAAKKNSIAQTLPRFTPAVKNRGSSKGHDKAGASDATTSHGPNS